MARIGESDRVLLPDGEHLTSQPSSPARITFADAYLAETEAILRLIDREAIESLVAALVGVKARRGRLFIMGVGGGAAHASHAVNDVRKLAGIEAYAPTDNVAEITARTNDDGWESVFVNWLKGSRLGPADLVLVFSVGGGDVGRNVSSNLVRALEYAAEIGSPIAGIVGRDGGYTARVAETCVIVPTVNPQRVTPHTESVQAVVWHLCVSHPDLQDTPAKWESVR
jgi:D-sedoheptulose 7-phosphate isomerase